MESRMNLGGTSFGLGFVIQDLSHLIRNTIHPAKMHPTKKLVQPILLFFLSGFADGPTSSSSRSGVEVTFSEESMLRRIGVQSNATVFLCRVEAVAISRNLNPP